MKMREDEEDEEEAPGNPKRSQAPAPGDPRRLLRIRARRGRYRTCVRHACFHTCSHMCGPPLGGIQHASGTCLGMFLAASVP